MMPTWYTNNFFTLTQGLDLQIDFLYGFFESEYDILGKTSVEDVSLGTRCEENFPAKLQLSSVYL